MKKRRYVSEIQTIRVKRYGFGTDRPQTPQDVRVRSSQRVVQQKPEKKRWSLFKKKPPEDEFIEVLEATHE